MKGRFKDEEKRERRECVGTDFSFDVTKVDVENNKEETMTTKTEARTSQSI